MLNLIKEALSEEKFKQFVYKKIVREYYVYYNINDIIFFQKKETKERFGKNIIINDLYKDIGGTEKKWDIIRDIATDISNKAKDILFDSNSQDDYKLDLSGDKPKFIKKVVSL